MSERVLKLYEREREREKERAREREGRGGRKRVCLKLRDNKKIS